MKLFFLYLFIDTYFKEEIVYNIVTSDLQHNRVRGSVGDKIALHLELGDYYWSDESTAHIVTRIH